MLLAGCASTPSSIDVGLFPETVPSNICYLKTTRQIRFLGLKTSFNATGTLFRDRYLVTAGHNVYDSWRTRLIGVDVFCKGVRGAVVHSRLESDQIERNRLVSQYDETFNNDYAFLRLEETIDVVPSLSLPEAHILDSVETISVAGYPGGLLTQGSGLVVKPLPSDGTFYYEVDTAKGMSGGPVWTEQEILVGVHVAEGRARLVDPAMITLFNQWIESFNED